MRERIRVDPANPGQVFACLGLLEVAGLLRKPATGRFDQGAVETQVQFELDSSVGIKRIITEIKEAELKEPEETGPLWEANREKGVSTEERSKTVPVQVRGSGWTLVIDAWLEPDRRKTNRLFKTWAGRVGSLQIIKALRDALDVGSNTSELFDWGVRMRPIGYDHRSAVSADNIGYYYNKVSDVLVYPVVDLFALIGLNHVRPPLLGNDAFEYFLWSQPLPPEVARAALTGAIPWLAVSRWKVTVESRGNFKTWARSKLMGGAWKIA